MKAGLPREVVMKPALGDTLYTVLHQNVRSGRMVPCRKPYKCDPARPHYVIDHNIMVDVELDAITALRAGFAQRLGNLEQRLNERTSGGRARTPFRIPAVSDNLRGGDVVKCDEPH